jgi:hypothetical protein
MELILKEGLNLNMKFSLYIDKCTDICVDAQLITNIRSNDGGLTKRNVLFWKEPSEQVAGDEIFRITDEYLSKNVKLKDCVPGNM